MSPQLFSQRHNLRPTPGGLLYEHVPQSARTGLCSILKDYFSKGCLSAEHLSVNINSGLGIGEGILAEYKSVSNHVSREFRRESVKSAVMTCKWWQFYDICEITLRSSHVTLERKAKDFAEEINALFRNERLGFEFVDGQVERVESGFMDAKIKQAGYLLDEPRFKRAGEHFQNAVRALSIDGDIEDCVADAAAAIESVAKTVSDNNEVSFDEFIKGLVAEGTVPRPLGRAFRDVYAYASGHRGIDRELGFTSKIDHDEARLLLGMSATIIIYLTGKRSKSPQSLTS